MSSADGSIKILLVDEDADYLNLTKRILENMSEFSIETTPDPAEALKIIDEIPVDAVVSYYQVSKISGLEFLRRVRERYNDLPFILLTDKNSEDVAVEALSLGADFFLQKDFNQFQVTELSNMVRQIVKLRRVEKNLRDTIIYKSILDSSPVAITINVEGKIVYANQKRAELTGHQFPQELVGVDSLQMVHPDDLETIRNRQMARRRGERFEPNFNYRAVTIQGETRYVETNSADILWGGEPALLFFSRDVTDEMRSQRQLAESRQRLQALHNQTVIINEQETYDEVVQVVYEALTKCLGYEVIDILKVEEEFLIDIYPEKETFSILISGSGITARAVRTGETQLISDTSLDPDYIVGFGRLAMRSELTVPVKVDGKVVYLLNIESEKPDVFTEEDRNLVEILAMHTSSTLEGLRNKERRRAYTKRLEALHNYGLSVGKVDSEDQVAKLTMDALQSVLEFKMCSFSVVEGDKLYFIYKSMPGTTDSLPLSGSEIIVRAVKTGKTQYVPDVWHDQSYVQTGTYYVLSQLSVPIMVEGKVQAVINVENEIANAFSDEDRALVELIAQHASSAFEHLLDNERQQLYARRLESLYTVTEAITSTSTIDDIAELVGTAVKEIIGHDLGSLAMVEEGALHHRYIWGVQLNKEYVLPLDGPGVTVRAVKTGKTQLIKDSSLENDFVNPDEAGVILSELAVPVKIGEEVVAVINVESRKKNAFGEDEYKLLSILGEHTGSAIHNMRLLENERGFAERLETLSWALASMSMAVSLEQLTDQTLTLVEEIIGAPYSMYMLVEGDTLVTVKTRGTSILGIRLPINGKSITARAAREKKPILVRNTRLDPDFVKGSLDSLSELAVPIIIDDKVVGVLNMESLETDYFNTSHISLAEALSAHVASNLERLFRNQQMREAQRRAIEERERAEQAERLEEMKTNFIRTATHEIRTPLTSIKGYTELSQALIDSEGSPTLANYFDIIMRNTERLERLTSDLLDVQRIETGSIELNKEPLQFRQLLSEVTAELEPILFNRSQKIIISGDDVTITANRTRLIQVFINLVVNASKFSPQDSEVMINIEDVGDDMQISVTDTGVGIEADDIPKLFTPFPGIRIEGVQSSTGLGLSICKGIVELHGGRIWAESEGLGKGSTFTFTLPKSESGVDA